MAASRIISFALVLFCLSNSRSSKTIRFFFPGLRSLGSGRWLADSKNLPSISDLSVWVFAISSPFYRILKKAFEEQLSKEAIVRLLDNETEIMNLNISPGHNFTGPGTKLDRRLNRDGTPMNRVDRAAYYHDLCYAKHPDTKTRNEICDREMLKELSQITDPSLRER